MTEKEIVVMAAEVAAKAAVAAVRAILGKEIQESVEAAVTDAARLGAEASIKAVEQERKKFRDGRSDRRFRNTKLLLRNYTVLNANCSHAVYDAASAATGEESVEKIGAVVDGCSLLLEYLTICTEEGIISAKKAGIWTKKVTDVKYPAMKWLTSERGRAEKLRAEAERKRLTEQAAALKAVLYPEP